jgi:hypothetical protein
VIKEKTPQTRIIHLIKLSRSHPLSSDPPFIRQRTLAGKCPLLGSVVWGTIHLAELLDKLLNRGFLPIQDRNVKNFLGLGLKMWAVDGSKICTKIPLKSPSDSLKFLSPLEASGSVRGCGFKHSHPHPDSLP